MKILMQNRTNLTTALAGDTVQVIKTKEYIQKLGLEVELSAAPDQDLTGYDLIHLFNIMPVQETYQHFLNARRQQKKIVLSPIYWDPAEYLKVTGQEATFGVWWTETMPLRREIMGQVAVLLPNSALEREALLQMFHRLPPVQVVPNAADRLFANATADRFRRKYGCQEQFVLTVGRICHRKNQLSLIRAMRQLNLPLVVIGPVNDGEYYQECRQAAGGWNKVLFIDTLTQEELASAYAAARVHALVSWFDTPGLVSLEAAMAGCRIVTTDRGTAEEYFGAAVDYCDPANPESIRRAVATAWERTGSTLELRKMVLTNYSWEQVARATLRGYRMAMGNSPLPEVSGGK